MDDRLLEQLRKSQDSELSLRNALDAGSIGHWSWVESEAMQWDEHMQRLFGIEGKEIPANLEDFLILLDPASQEAAIEAFEAAFKENATLELTVTAERSGQTLRFSGRPYFLPGKEGPALSGLCMKAPKEKAPTAARELEPNAELANFASVASHDLREPLRMITSYLSLLQERSPDSLDDKAKRYIKYACEGADRMRQLIEDLLSYSRLDSEAEPPSSVNLAWVINETMKILSPVIQETHASVAVNVENPPHVLGDQTSLVRLFQNLLSNAIKFHKQGETPRIEISISDGDDGPAPGFWLVYIKDHGIGIDPEHHELLFGIFQRLHTRDEFEGSGIGLAVCRKIVDRIGGRITIQSEKGKGSTFMVYLKKARAQDEAL